MTFSQDRYIRGETIDATVTATYYYGAPVAGAKATITAYRSDDRSRAGGQFRSRPTAGGGESDAGEPIVDETVHLDDRGQAHLRVPTKDAPGPPGTRRTRCRWTWTTLPGGAFTPKARRPWPQGLFSLDATPSVQFCHPATR